VSNSSAVVYPSQRNLLETGSEHLAGGAEAVAKAAQELNFYGANASDLMTLMKHSKNKVRKGWRT